jgi:hypothetical protein
MKKERTLHAFSKLRRHEYVIEPKAASRSPEPRVAILSSTSRKMCVNKPYVRKTREEIVFPLAENAMMRTIFGGYYVEIARQNPLLVLVSAQSAEHRRDLGLKPPLIHVATGCRSARRDVETANGYTFKRDCSDTCRYEPARKHRTSEWQITEAKGMPNSDQNCVRILSTIGHSELKSGSTQMFLHRSPAYTMRLNLGEDSNVRTGSYKPFKLFSGTVGAGIPNIPG